MTMQGANSVCPLCASRRLVATSRIPVAPIAAYWRGIGYDLKAAFPDLPDFLTKFHCPRCDLRFFLPRLIGEADLYAALQRTEIYYGATKWEFATVLSLLAKQEQNGSLLEYGCGRGNFLEQVSPYFSRALGVDFNEQALAECREKGLDVSSPDPSALDETYDVIVSFQVLEHLPNPGEVVADLAGRLGPGGCLVVAVPNEDGPLGEIENNFLNLPPHHFTRWTQRTMRYLAKMNGLELERYICEPLNEALYLTLLNERFARHLSEEGFLARLLSAAARRIAIGGALARFDEIRTHLAGHTQIAMYRKPDHPTR